MTLASVEPNPRIVDIQVLNIPLIDVLIKHGFRIQSFSLVQANLEGSEVVFYKERQRAWHLSDELTPIY